MTEHPDHPGQRRRPLLEPHSLSELFGEQAWRESGLGAPEDIDQLKQQIVSLEQHVVDLRLQLEERDQDLAAARATNRELMTQLNASRQA